MFLCCFFVTFFTTETEIFFFFMLSTCAMIFNWWLRTCGGSLNTTASTRRVFFLFVTWSKRGDVTSVQRDQTCGEWRRRMYLLWQCVISCGISVCTFWHPLQAASTDPKSLKINANQYEGLHTKKILKQTNKKKPSLSPQNKLVSRCCLAKLKPFQMWAGRWWSTTSDERAFFWTHFCLCIFKTERFFSVFLFVLPFFGLFFIFENWLWCVSC